MNHTFLNGCLARHHSQLGICSRQHFLRNGHLRCGFNGGDLLIKLGDEITSKIVVGKLLRGLGALTQNGEESGSHIG